MQIKDLALFRIRCFIRVFSRISRYAGTRCPDGRKAIYVDWRSWCDSVHFRPFQRFNILDIQIGERCWTYVVSLLRSTNLICLYPLSSCSLLFESFRFCERVGSVYM
ncbi:hypothetical protein Mapa_014490 [Marchantia paleacea]|nr:hypothetical protein Mapa_014490 [Marchantia paleacea]